MICPKCGNELRDGVRFCRYCGTRLNTPVTPQPVAQNPTPTHESPRVTVERQPIDYDVILISCGKKKLEVVKCIKESIKCDLHTAKDLSETPNSTIATFADAEQAEKLKSALERLGAHAEIKDNY